MIEGSRLPQYRSSWQATAVTSAEYQMLYSNRRKAKKRWRFKPRSLWPLLTWAFLLFIFCRLLVFPLAEGIYNYFTKTMEISELKDQYQAINRQLGMMNKDLAYMNTESYVKERSHQMGYIQPNEAQMVMVEPSNDGQDYQPKRKKRVEITD